jgi:hypothetical protein
MIGIEPPYVLMRFLFALVMAFCAQSVAADPVAVRFIEGVAHGFLALRTPDGGLIAAGDLMQVARHGAVESRTVFRFTDGSLWDETVLFTQERVFVLQSYRLLQKGPVFPQDSEVTLERDAAKYRVKTTARGGGREVVLDGAFSLPQDTYNGMVVTVAKNLPRGARETVHLLVFTPTARLIELEIAPAGEHKVLVGQLVKSARHYVLTPKLGPWLKLLTTLTGRLPPDSHAWIFTDEAPSFVRFEGPLHSTGPVWHMELTSPRWPD